MDEPLIQRLSSLLEGRRDLDLVVLFGSCARGTACSTSDVDVAVFPAGALSAVEESELEAAIESASGRQVDLVRLDRVDDVVLRREIAIGVPLREAVPGTFARFAAEAALEWLDFEPCYLDAQARYLRRVAGRAP